MVDFIEASFVGGFRSVPTGLSLLLNADPGLRFACPGLLSILPPGVRRSRFHPPRVGEAGGRLTLLATPFAYFRKLLSRTLSKLRRIPMIPEQ